MAIIENIIARAILVRPHIVMADGEDPRVVQAAFRAVEAGIASITLLGNPDAVRQHGDFDLAPDRSPSIIDPVLSDLTSEFAAEYLRLRERKGATAESSRAAVQSPLGFAAMMVRFGLAGGTVGGALTTTAETVRAALTIIGMAKGAKLVSSFFLMLLEQPHHARTGAVVFADCGIVVDPSADELAAIALASGQSFERLSGETPRVAMLSFSSLGSASHASASKVSQATRLVKARAPDVIIEGEVQFDTAFVPEVSARKTPTSCLHGQANVFVFPNLDAGNIGYKIAQRLGGAKAIGPILQGLAKPANDLSRGASADDIFHMIAVTSLQCEPG
jgi:phosphate acetyltransferase